MSYDEFLNNEKGAPRLILELRDELYSFYRLLSEMRNLKPDINEVFSLLFEFLHDEEIAVIGLDNYCMDLLRYGVNEETEDSEILSIAVRRIGLEIFDKLRMLGLYTENGILNYKFCCWLDPLSPVLEKFLETDG